MSASCSFSEAEMYPSVRKLIRVVAWVCASISMGTAYADNPATCSAVKQAAPGSADGEYTLYWKGDATKPWQAYCAGMAGASPTEYLTLPHSRSTLDNSRPPDVNFARYSNPPNPPARSGVGTENRLTFYQKIRIDPVTLRVDVTDSVFSIGRFPHQQPYASAGTCDYSLDGAANIDLRDTPFSVAANAFVVSGYFPRGSWNYSSHNQVVDLIGGGYCGGSQPSDSIHLPLVYTDPIGGIQVDAGGNVGVGSPAPVADLHVIGTARVDGSMIVTGSVQGQQPGYGRAAVLEGSNPAGRPVQFVLQYDPSSNPGTIRIQNITDNVAKTFVIPHPTDPSRYLVHATLEGPEAAVFYRGSATLVNGRAEITLPCYFETLAQAEGRTVQLTNVDGFDRLAVESQHGQQVRNGAFVVISNDLTSRQAFNWEVKAVRADVPPLETEPEVDRVVVDGFGPYTFIKSQTKRACPPRPRQP